MQPLPCDSISCAGRLGWLKIFTVYPLLFEKCHFASINFIVHENIFFGEESGDELSQSKDLNILCHVKKP